MLRTPRPEVSLEAEGLSPPALPGDRPDAPAVETAALDLTERPGERSSAVAA